MAETENKWGGRRKRAGRRAKGSIVEGGPELCQRVIGRIHELKRPGIKTFEDYLLFVLLGAQDVRVNKETAIAMLYSIHGKPPQRTEVSGPGGGPIIGVQITTNVSLPNE